MGRRTRIGAVLAAVGMLATMVAAAPAEAATGDAIDNPGPITFTVDAGGFLNIGGNAFALPSTATPQQCRNGVNDDTAVDDAVAQQDANIDFDGGATAGVTPATAVDAQCNAGGGGTAANDDSEAKAGNQPRAYITLTGDIDADGHVTIPQGGISFPRFYVFSKAANGVIDVIPAATGPATGTFDPLTRQVEVDLDWQLEVLQAFFKIDCISPVSMSLTTEISDPRNLGDIPVHATPFDADTSTFTLASNTFAVGGFAPNPAPAFTPATGQATCDTVGNGFGIPAAAGQSAAELAVHTSRVPTSGLTPRIAGIATDTADQRLPGITVTLMSPHPSWTVVATRTTDAQGTFAFDNIPGGAYVIRFFDGTGQHARTWHGGTTYRTADTIGIGPGGSIHFTEKLPDAPPGSISGRANLADGSGVPGELVEVYTAADGLYATTTTGPSGWYHLGGVPDGQYYVRFSGTGHPTQWFRFKLLFFRAEKVTVAGGRTWASALLG